MAIKNIDKSATLRMYKEKAIRCLSRFINVEDIYLNDAVDYSINKRYIKENCTISNSYTKKDNDASLLAVSDFINEQKPICTAYGTMFMKHEDCPNPMATVVDQFLMQRDKDKAKMFTFPKGSEDFEKYNLLQVLDKIDANGIYGVLGMYTSLLYNINVCSSVTSQGRALISSATMFFESFLANNVKFGSLDEVLVFIDNVCGEDRKFLDEDFIDNNISIENCFAKLIDSCGYKWIPNNDEMNIIWDTLLSLTSRDLNRLYYKNNLYEFCSNSVIKKLIIKMMESLRAPFFNSLKVPETISDDLDFFTDILKEFVYYDKMIIDRIDRCDNMIKSVTAVSDTDSCIISLDAWYHFALDIVKDEDLYIKKFDPISIFTVFEKDEFGDIKDMSQIQPFKFLEPEEHYDFENDEIIYQKHAINPFKILTSDYLRYSIVNIMATVISKLNNDYMIKFTQNNNSWSPVKKCRIYMKNEFSFNRVLITLAAKHYASLMKIQEGNIIPESERLDVKGIDVLAKSTSPNSVKSALKQILLEDILTAPTIDQYKIIEKISILEKKIINSLDEGSKEYFKPVTVKAISSYQDPMRIQGVKASVAWNMLKPSDLQGIDLNERNAISVAKITLNKKNVDEVLSRYPEVYENAIKLLDHQNFKGSVDAIAIPLDVPTPEWLTDLIDYKTIIHDDISGFVYDSVGITRINSAVTYSNILQI